MKRAECLECGTSIKPWFETCFDCHQREKRNARGYGKFPEKIKASDFMKEMGISHW